MLGFVGALIALLIAYGVPISEEQKLQTIGFVGAAWALIQALATRSQVSPVATVEAIEDEADAAIGEAYHEGYVDAITAEASINRAPLG